MKQSYFYPVALIFALMAICLPFNVSAQESGNPPEGWDIMYFNMGENEYCSTTFENGSDNLQFYIFKDGISISITCGTDSPKSCVLNFGSVKIPCDANEYGELIVDLKDKKFVDALAKIISEKLPSATLEYGAHSQTIAMDNQAARNMVKALEWVRNNPIGMNME